MRTITMIATKNHFVFVVQTTDLQDTLHVATEYPVGNPIGFLAEGSASPFKKDGLENSSWEKYGEFDYISPHLHIRSEKSLLGASATSESTTYITVMSRESDKPLEEWKNTCVNYHLHNFATDDELLKIQNPATAVILNKSWRLYNKRTPSAFLSLEHPDGAEISLPSASNVLMDDIDFSGI
jgi:hypothetical protein